MGSIQSIAINDFCAKEVKMVMQKSVLLPRLLTGSYWLCHKKHKGKLNAVEIRSLSSNCGKTGKNRIKNEQILNGCAMNAKVSDWNEVCWDDIERINENENAINMSESTERKKTKKPWQDRNDEILKNTEVFIVI